ncbi:hypothetical protein D3C74_318800 [compost metagenome]
MIRTTGGIIIVPRTTRNSVFLNGNFSLANAKATMEHEISAPMTDSTVMMTLFIVYWPNAPSFQTST